MADRPTAYGPHELWPQPLAPRPMVACLHGRGMGVRVPWPMAAGHWPDAHGLCSRSPWPMANAPTALRTPDIA